MADSAPAQRSNFGTRAPGGQVQKPGGGPGQKPGKIQLSIIFYLNIFF